MTDDFSVEFEDQNDEIESTYIRYNIASYPSDLTLSCIKEMWDANAIYIPSFQRKYVWKKTKPHYLLIPFYVAYLYPLFFSI